MGDEGRAMNSDEILADGSAQPRVGVGVMLVDRHGDSQGRVLLTLRKFAPEAGCWSIVGGKLDFLESLENCAIREALEEVGLTIAIDSLLCVTDHILPEEGQHWVSPAYLGRVLAGEARNCEPEKTRAVQWFRFDELPQKLTMTAKNAIEAYRRRFGFYSAAVGAS
jgi:8-oxo-dGTP diphosphatase